MKPYLLQRPVIITPSLEKIPRTLAAVPQIYTQTFSFDAQSVKYSLVARQLSDSTNK